MDSTVSGEESRGDQGFRTGERAASWGGPQIGDRVGHGDNDSDGGARVTSGDGDTTAGKGSGLGGNGSGGGSVSVGQVRPGPITPPTFSLEALSSEVGDDAAIVDRFVGDFLALLDARLDRIAACLRAGDCETAVVALLSLETTAAMIGAHDLAAPARVLRRAVTEGIFAESEQLNAAIIDAAEQLRDDLRAVTTL